MNTAASPTVVPDTFERDGYAIFRRVVDADLIQEASDHVEWLQRTHADVPTEALTHDYMTPFWHRVMSDDRILDIAQLFVGPNIASYSTHHFVKMPFAGKRVEWHQDAAFWPLEPMEVVTLWLAIDHSTPENGCLRIIPGSHKWSVEEMRPTEEDGYFHQQIKMDVDESQALDIVLAPGDIEVHHPGIVHGSNANSSPSRRAGLAIRYIPTSTLITEEIQPFTGAFWFRGERGANRFREPLVYREGVDFAYRGAGA